MHRVGLASSAEIEADLSKLDLLDKALNISDICELIIFDISEDDERWRDVERIIKKYGASDITTTKFTAKEKREAKYLRMVSTWHHGYPEPAIDNQFINVTYNTSNYCPTCGVGLIQKDSFRFNKEPAWGKKEVLQVNWVFDDFFVKPSTYKKIFQPFEVEALPVLNHKTGKPLKSVVQLKIAESVALKMDNHDSNTCSSCGAVKYLPVVRGFFPALTSNMKEGSHLAISTVYFGSGCDAHKAVIVSNKLFKTLTNEKVKGIDFIPLN